MKKIKTLLFVILVAVPLTSCTFDHASLGSRAVSYPSYRTHTPVHVPAIYRTMRPYRHVDVRPDWMRYGGNWSPLRRQRCHH